MLITDPEIKRMIQPNISDNIWNANISYACVISKLMGLLDVLMQPTLYIMEVYANNLYICAMFQQNAI